MSLDTARIDRVFHDYRLDAKIPGVAYGVVDRSGILHFAGQGVQDLVTRRPVGLDTVFRMASMTKAFTALTILALRDEGRLTLDDPVATHVPELAGWREPGLDSAPIRLRDLLHHTAGLVTDDPWGDRQNPLPESAFSALLLGGVPFTRPPASAFEYSNLGYAVLGRVITNVSGDSFASATRRRLLEPLAMASATYDWTSVHPDVRALGYRWEANDWRAEPELDHGTFGAMGGLHSSARDYVRWLQFLLQAWPARSAPETGPLRRSSVRELLQGLNFPRVRPRPGAMAGAPASLVFNYGMGMDTALDPLLGLTASHSGGYPGYGSHMLLLPERGIALFAFTNRTYGGPIDAVWDAASLLQEGGGLPEAPSPIPDDALEAAHRTAQAIYVAGRTEVAADALAMNFLADRDAGTWARELATLRAGAGEFSAVQTFTATGAQSASFVWTCAHGRVRGELLLAPTRPAGIQALRLDLIQP